MSDHQAPTGQITTVTLPSALEQVVWAQPAAALGAQATLEVFSRFVGNGAPMQIKLTDHTGKTHGTFNESLYANRFSVSMQVPAEAEVALYAEVKLPDHGVTQQSGPLLLAPPIRIERCAWSQEKATRGDVLTLTADVKGAVDGTEAVVTVFEYDADGAHEVMTSLPVLVEGEAVEAEWTLQVQDLGDQLAQGEPPADAPPYEPLLFIFRVTALGVTGESPQLVFVDWVGVEVFEAGSSAAYANLKAVLHLPDGSTREETLDANGAFVFDEAPFGRCTLELPDLYEASSQDPQGPVSPRGPIRRRPLDFTAKRPVQLTIYTGYHWRVPVSVRDFQLSV